MNKKTILNGAVKHMLAAVEKEANYGDPTPWTLYPVWHQQLPLPKHLQKKEMRNKDE